ncbi:MAG: cytidylate kinase family protein [Candidatus Bathyarchaeia archaeon]
MSKARSAPHFSVICISGLTASGKSTVAKMLAERYGLKYYSGGGMLKELAISEGYTSGGEDWWSTEDGKRFLRERLINPDYDRRVDQMLLKKAEEGNVVLDSWTMPWLLNYGFKVWIEASREVRAKRLSGRSGESIEDALKALENKDGVTRKIYKSLYDIDLGLDLSPFHVILDNSNLSVEETYKTLCEVLDRMVFKGNQKTL